MARLLGPLGNTGPPDGNAVQTHSCKSLPPPVDEGKGPGQMRSRTTFSTSCPRKLGGNRTCCSSSFVIGLLRLSIVGAAFAAGTGAASSCTCFLPTKVRHLDSLVVLLGRWICLCACLQWDLICGRSATPCDGSVLTVCAEVYVCFGTTRT